MILIALFAVAIVACKKEVGDYTYRGMQTMLLASRTTERQSYQIGENEFLTDKFYLVKTTGKENDWGFYNTRKFVDFEYKEGYESVIVVEVYERRNAPSGEVGYDCCFIRYKYKLKRIVSQEQKDSEDLPSSETIHKYDMYYPGEYGIN